jgi:hypothetical protein
MAKRISTSDLEHVNERLGDALKAECSIGLRETIARLLPRLEQLRSNGQSVQTIVTLLKQSGLPISAPTLRRYWRHAESETRKAKKTEPKASTPSSVRLGRSVPNDRQQPDHDSGKKKPETTDGSRSGRFVVIPDSERI